MKAMQFHFFHGCLAAALVLVLAAPAQAQRQTPAQKGISDGVVKIGVLTDLSGAYADNVGAGSILASKLAIEEFGGKVLGKPIELVEGDHLNRVDVGAGIARQWFDRDQVDVVTELSNSAVALAVMNIAQAKHRMTMVTGAGSAAITNENCTANNVEWAYSTYALAKVSTVPLVRSGLKSWYFIAADYVFGHSVVDDSRRLIAHAGGKVVGSSYYPFPSTDFATYLLTAQASGAQTVAFASSGHDLQTEIQQANEFGLTRNQQLVGLFMSINNVHNLGLDAVKGLRFAKSFYWDRDTASRDFAQRFFHASGRMPTAWQAGQYSAVLNYLRAVQAAGTDDVTAVMATLHKMPIKDAFAQHARLRTDGQLIHDFYVVSVKSPAESKGPWDYYKIEQTVPGDEAFQPLSESRCPLVTQGAPKVQLR